MHMLYVYMLYVYVMLYVWNYGKSIFHSITKVLEVSIYSTLRFTRELSKP